MNNYNYNELTPFKWFILENFPLIDEDFDALTNWQLFCKLGKEMNKLIDSQNNVGEQVENVTDAFIALQNYVNNYFDNLDVQEEINNKLDEMAEDGTLQEIIASYLNTKAIFGFDTVADLKNAENLIDGSFACTYGFYNKNDGGGAFYKIRTITNDDVVDETFIFEMENDDTLIAELIFNSEISVLSLGLKNDGITDNSSKMSDILTKITSNTTLYFPSGNFYFSEPINMSDYLIFKGNELTKYDTTPTASLIFAGNGFTGSNYSLYNLNLVGTNKENNGIGQGRYQIKNCSITNFGNAIYTPRASIIENCQIYKNLTGINGAIDSKIINNFIYNNDNNGIYLYQGSNDNIISNNKIEWNGSNGINIYNASDLVLTGNIIDRSYNYGIICTQGTKITITSNVFRRNYAEGSQQNFRGHVRLESSTYVNFSNNITRTGNSEDDGSGINVPYNSLYLTACANINLIGNDLTGATTQAYTTYNNTGEITKIDITTTPHALYSQYLRTQLPTKSVTHGSNNTFEITISRPTLYALPNYVEVLMNYRRTDQGDYGSKKFIVSIHTAGASTTQTKIEQLTDNKLNDNLTLSTSYDNETGKLTITATNSHGSFDYSVGAYTYNV